MLIKIDPKVGRAEALRCSMLALIAAGGGYAHPANWAPFVVWAKVARTASKESTVGAAS
jgi:CHAT domain-containing protein